MTMRDLQRLEELSSTAALGLWADDVVVAISHALSGLPLSDAEKRLLKDAAHVLAAAAERTAKPLSPPRSARALAATDTALVAVATLARESDDREQRNVMTTLAKVIRKAVKGALEEGDAGQLDLAMRLFAIFGELQLVESNSVLTARKDARAWTETQTISHSF
jgi:hypothetical protein